MGINQSKAGALLWNREPINLQPSTDQAFADTSESTRQHKPSAEERETACRAQVRADVMSGRLPGCVRAVDCGWPGGPGAGEKLLHKNAHNAQKTAPKKPSHETADTSMGLCDETE
jgi:hypothetical protein